MKRSAKTQDMLVKKEKFIRNGFPTLTPMNSNQADLLEALKFNSLIIASGCAGVGKSLVALWHASKRLYYGDIKKIVLIRAYQPLAGRSIGFLPGTLDEKLTPFYQQMLDYLEDYLGKASTEIHLKNKTIEICSLETIRGRSWDRSIIIVDEAQNLFVPEVQALVTRIGKDSQMIFCGDDSGTQTDIKNTMNGLSYLEALVNKYYISDTSFIKFTKDDIVRSGITKEFVIAFESELEASKDNNSIVCCFNATKSNTSSKSKINKEKYESRK